MSKNPERGVGYGGSKCLTCGRTWPQTTFRKLAAAVANGELDFEPVCDACLNGDSREGQIAEKVDEAQSGCAPKLTREIRVSGIESKTNVTEFSYTTHRGVTWELTLTDLTVTFKGNIQYVYRNVPVVVCEAWYAAPSKGGYFQQFIRSSYEFEKVK